MTTSSHSERDWMCLILSSVMQSFPEQYKQLFVYRPTLLTAAQLWGLIEMPRPQESKQQQAVEWFKTYLDDQEYSYGEYMQLGLLTLSLSDWGKPE